MYLKILWLSTLYSTTYGSSQKSNENITNNKTLSETSGISASYIRVIDKASFIQSILQKWKKQRYPLVQFLFWLTVAMTESIPISPGISIKDLVSAYPSV